MTTGYPVITWTRLKLRCFVTAYGDAQREGVDVFIFDGHEFYTGYAKYLIEFLETRLPK